LIFKKSMSHCNMELFRTIEQDIAYREQQAIHGAKGAHFGILGKPYGHLGKSYGHLGAIYGKLGGRPRKQPFIPASDNGTRRQQLDPRQVRIGGERVRAKNPPGLFEKNHQNPPKASAPTPTPSYSESDLLNLLIQTAMGYSLPTHQLIDGKMVRMRYLLPRLGVLETLLRDMYKNKKLLTVRGKDVLH